MVCDRCIRVVSEEFSKLGLSVESIELGKVALKNEPTSNLISEITEALYSSGFELLDVKKEKLVNQIKTSVINLIHHELEIEEHINLSEFISNELDLNYSYLSSLFSSMEGITIEKYVIHQKIEKVKELLSYRELNLKEISYMLGYSSLQHLSAQFKKATGLSPKKFIEQNQIQRKPLDKV